MSTITDEMVEAACFSYWEIYREMWRPSGVLTPSLDLPFDELSSFLKNPTRIAMRAALEAAERVNKPPLQTRVKPWMTACFGDEISADAVERRHRFIEEALELLQAAGGTRDEALQLVEYVFSRPVGDIHQEVGGVMITLAALCLASSLDMHSAGEDELARIWTKVDAIRAKQAAKPKFSVLPSPPEKKDE